MSTLPTLGFGGPNDGALPTFGFGEGDRGTTLESLPEETYLDTTAAALVYTEWLVTNFDVKHGIEGPQISITWTAPVVSNVPGTLIRIVRKALSRPMNAGDGAIVFEGPTSTTCFVDLTTNTFRCYSYKIYTFRPGFEDWLSDPGLERDIIPFSTGFFRDHFFRYLPTWYAVADQKLNRAEQGLGVLQRALSSDLCQYFNMVEDGTVNRGQLERFIRILALEFDYVKGLIDTLPYFYDPATTCSTALPHIAKLIGLGVDLNLSVERQRAQVQNEVEILKMKGTPTGVEAKARSTTGLQAEVTDHCSRIMETNRADRLTVSPNTDPALTFEMVTDSLALLPGETHNYRSFALHLFLTCDSCVDVGVSDALEKIFDDYAPACSVPTIILHPCEPLERVYSNGLVPPVDWTGTAEEYWDYITSGAGAPANGTVELNPYNLLNDIYYDEVENLVPDPKSPTPDPAALMITTFAPDISWTILVVPSKIGLIITPFTPAVSRTRLVTPETETLVSTFFTPTVGVNWPAVPGTLGLVITPFAATLWANQTRIPNTVALVITPRTPRVLVQPRPVPNKATLVIATLVPTVTVG